MNIFIFISNINFNKLIMVKSQNKLLNKKRKKNFSKKFIKKTIEGNKNITINIKNSIYSFENLQEKENNEIFKLNKVRKSSIVKSIDKSKISYVKCNYNSINEISYKYKKLINVPKKFYEYHSRSLIFLRLVFYKKKKILFFGYLNNLLIYEIFDDNMYLIKSFYKENTKREITNIFLLEDNLSNELKFFLIIKNKGILWEFNLKDYTLNNLKENILFDKGNTSYNFKYIKNNKILIYNYNCCFIYNINNNEKKILILKMDDYNNIQNCQKLKENLYIILSDKILFIFNSLTDLLLYTVEKELHFYWVKVLSLKDNQFLLYTSSDISVFDFNYQINNKAPKLNRKLQLNNIKNIRKIKQVNNGDLVIYYNFYNLAIYDLKKNIIKYHIMGQKVEGNTIFHYSFIIKEIEPNVIAYKKNLNQINFINIVKGENLGNFSVEYNNILVLKKIKVNSIENFENDNNGKIFYFILTNNSSFIIYK